MPHKCTQDEWEALQLFTAHDSVYTPHLLSWAAGVVEEGIDAEAMVGGYVRFFLMTKVPGRSFSAAEFCKLLLSERDAFREGFKEALL